MLDVSYLPPALVFVISPLCGNKLSSGKLLRTMLYSLHRVTSRNRLTLVAVTLYYSSISMLLLLSNFVSIFSCPQIRDQQTFSEKSQRVNIFSVRGHMVSVTTSLVTTPSFSRKGAVGST